MPKLSEAIKHLPLLEDIVLDILRRKDYPMTEKELQKAICDKIGQKISLSLLKNAMNTLDKRGYDIKSIISRDLIQYVLVRYGEQEIEKKKRYRIAGKIRTPVICAADFHVGSRHFTEQGFYQLVDCAKEERVKDILCVGDLIQGLGVYGRERMDLAVSGIDEQVDMLTDYLKMLPRRIKIHTTIGGHEEVLKGRHEVGYDALKDIAQRLPNVYYYGATCNLELNNKWTVLGMHSSGVSQTTSSRVENIWKNLPSPRPNILVVGHRHQLLDLKKNPTTLLIESGTLQRENSYLMFKGYISQVGWIVLRKFGYNQVDSLKVTPTVY